MRSSPARHWCGRDRPGNLAFETSAGDAAATRQAFSKAARVSELTIVNQRLVTNYLDTRGVIAEYDGDRYTLTLGSQGSHLIRDIIGGSVMKLPPEKMRVITPDVGGGFGTKAFPYREYALAAVAAERLRKPVRWICERAEHFLADSQAAIIFPPRGWRSTTRGASSRSNSILSPTWGPTCRATHLLFRGSVSAWRPAPTISRLRMCGCARSIRTRSRLMPIVAPDGQKLLISSNALVDAAAHDLGITTNSYAGKT